MSAATTTLLLLAAGTYVLKAAGPLVLGNRTLPPRLAGLVALLPAPLLAALVAVSVLADGTRLRVDATLVGTLAAAVALWRGAGFVTTVLVAAGTTALLRALGVA